MMTRVLIDGRYCTTDEGFVAPRNIVTLNADADSSTLQQQRVRISLPASELNDTIIGLATDAFTAERFNAEEHVAAIEVDGVELFSGAAALEAITIGGSSSKAAIHYELVITRSGEEWREQLHKKPLAETALDFAATLNGECIQQSWSGEQSVRFLPVFYDQYIAPYDENSLYPPQRMMSVEDYMPFISARELVRQIFAGQGYTVKSQFIESDLFGKLYIEGRYALSNKSATRLDAIAGFCAGRTASATASASSLGRVYLSNAILNNSLGAFIDTDSSSDASDLYDNGNGLVADVKRPYYKPPIAATMSFELYIKYTTDFRILSRHRLKCFDGVYVTSNCDIRHSVSNNFVDRRDSLQANVEYHCIVFDHTQGAAYRVVGLTSTGEQVISEFSARSAKVTIPTDWSGLACRLDVADQVGNYSPYEADWAMYDGFVEDTGTTEVEMVITTPSEELTPSTTKYFDQIYIYGAEEGQSITLWKDCRLRTKFSATPSLGSTLTAADIMHFEGTQGEFIEALQQMFNLKICSNAAARELIIEPKESFHTAEEIDWSDRILLSESVRVEELAAVHNRTICLGYRAENDGAVGRFNKVSESKLGDWSVECDSQIAVEGVESRRNSLFCPTLSATGVLGIAPSAALLHIGDRDSDEQGDTTMRIVRYEGLQSLPTSEKWGFPSYGNAYPLAAFHYPASLTEADGAAIVGNKVAAGPYKAFTLGFEDRDGAEGLNSYYKEELSTLNRRRRVELALRLYPEEILNLTEAGSLAPSQLSLIRLGEGQKALYSLVAIKGYDTRQAIAYCVVERWESN